MGTQERPSDGFWQFTNCIDYVAYIGFMSATCSQVYPVWGYSQEMLGPIGFDKPVPPHGFLSKVAFSLLASLDIAHWTHWSNMTSYVYVVGFSMQVWLWVICESDEFTVISNLEFEFVYSELVVLCLSLFFWILTWASSKWTWIHGHTTETGFAALKFMYGWAWHCFSPS